jgi:hypothetical protein
VHSGLGGLKDATVENETDIILKTFMSYAKAFETLKPLAVLSYFHRPALLVSARKSVAMTTWLGVFLVLRKIMNDLKKRGYAKNEFVSIETKLLSEHLALVSGVATRYKVDGSELESFGFTYTLCKTGKGWKIIVGVLHDISAALQFA